jgi:hypothetical protein
MSDNNEEPSKDLEPFVENYSVIDKLLEKGHDDSASNDFEMARANIHEMINDGKASLLKLAQIAASSQHPRAFEVYAKLMDTVLNANKELLNLQTKIREINHADSPVNEKAKSVTNNLFVGSTAELQKMIQEMKKDD